MPNPGDAIATDVVRTNPKVNSQPSPSPPPLGESPGRESSGERQALFNGIAPAYNLLNDVLSLGQHRLWKLQTVAFSEAAPGDHVLDLCCGSGDLALLLALRVRCWSLNTNGWECSCAVFRGQKTNGHNNCGSVQLWVNSARQIFFF